MTDPPLPRRKKRVRPARKIVPRGRMGRQWVVGPIVIAAIILAAGILLILSNWR